MKDFGPCPTCGRNPDANQAATITSRQDLFAAIEGTLKSGWRIEIDHIEYDGFRVYPRQPPKYDAQGFWSHDTLEEALECALEWMKEQDEKSRTAAV